MRRLRMRWHPAALLAVVPVVAIVMLTQVGPGASERVTPAAASRATTTTARELPAEAAAATPPDAAPVEGSDPNWADSYDGTGGSARRPKARVAGATADQPPATSPPASQQAAANTEVPPDAVVSESSSPIVLIVVAVGVVAIGIGGLTVWRRRRASS